MLLPHNHIYERRTLTISRTGRASEWCISSTRLSSQRNLSCGAYKMGRLARFRPCRRVSGGAEVFSRVWPVGKCCHVLTWVSTFSCRLVFSHVEPC